MVCCKKCGFEKCTRCASVAFGKLAAGYLGESSIIRMDGNRFRGWSINWENEQIFE